MDELAAEDLFRRPFFGKKRGRRLPAVDLSLNQFTAARSPLPVVAKVRTVPRSRVTVEVSRLRVPVRFLIERMKNPAVCYYVINYVLMRTENQGW
jgi:hypothetical protein